MNPLDLINHIRQCNLGEVRSKLERLERFHPDEYLVVENFILSCKPDNPLKDVVPPGLS
jgi:hypothetical protein